MLGLLVGLADGLLVGWLLGCTEGAALGRTDGARVDGIIVGAVVGLAEGRFSGHDCVYEGEETTLLGNVCKALDDQGVLFTDDVESILTILSLLAPARISAKLRLLDTTELITLSTSS